MPKSNKTTKRILERKDKPSKYAIRIARQNKRKQESVQG